MGLTNKKEEQLRKMPKIETRISKSKDGRFLIHKTVMTTIRPVNYYKAIFNNTEQVDEEDLGVLEEA
jgi:hypothetical protein